MALPHIFATQVGTIPLSYLDDNFNSVAASSGISYNQGSTGAATITQQAKNQQTLSIADFTGADKTGATDSLAAFTSAIAATPTVGGTITIPAGLWQLSAVPTWGTKSINWVIDSGATFTGAGTNAAGKFPTMMTNSQQIAVGPFIQSQSTVPSPGGGGIAAFQVEMLQPSSYGGQSVGIYAGASSSGAGNIWACNFLTTVASSFTGVSQGIEVDVNCYSSTYTNVKGISVNGVGSQNPGVGYEVIRSDTSLWKVGIDLRNTIIAARIHAGTGLTTGIYLDSANQQSNCFISGGQLSNAGDGVVIQRATDTSPTGNAFRLVNATNSQNLFSVDVLGNINSLNGSITVGGNITGLATGKVSTGAIVLNAGAASQAAGVVCIGNTLAASATTGTGGALPATPQGYLDFFIGSTVYKLPYYNT